VDWSPLLNRFEQATNLFTIAGQTVTGNGTPLANCRIVVYETGRMAVDGGAYRSGFSSESPVVAEALSDGSGNFTINVPMNVAYQLTGYLEGSPDRAGITRKDVVPSNAVLIYLRDPTSPDVGGGSAVYRPIGSPIVRRISQ
jgi:hypothetical protein